MPDSNGDLIVLGVCYNGDAGAAVIKNGRIVAAISEERLNREKLWYGVPHRSIEWVLRSCGLGWSDIDCVATHDGTDRVLAENRRPHFENMARRIQDADGLSASVKAAQTELLWKKYDHIEYVTRTRTIGHISEIEQYGRPVERVDHHVAHAASAYFTSGWNDCYTVTIDGWSTDGSNILCRCYDGRIEVVSRSSIIDSVGYFYGSITKYLGFTPERHEGKILGLSARGNPDACFATLSNMIRFDEPAQSFRGLMERGVYVPYFDNPWLKAHLNGASREDVSAAAQRVLEDVVLAYIERLVPPGSRLAFAGGVAANVRLNQKILSLPNIRELFVFPSMGDGGLAVGAALYAYSQKMPLRPFKLDNVYFGPAFRDEEIEAALTQGGVRFERCADVDGAVADLLAEGHVVARFAGRMEYGPRALGHRSILYRADDPSVNDWLNEDLHRTEFMPFAPVTLAEAAKDCYVIEKNAAEPARFMTITCDCTPAMRRQSPGVVHVDGTARPQLVHRDQNPGYHAIVERYRARTGNPSLINTSFNMHEEPIVCSPADAVRAFTEASIPYLAIGSFLVRR